MSKPDERLWLQWEGDGEGEVTWCQDKINDDDIEYVREDLVAWARWIPVSERLPESMDDIWLWDYDEPVKGFYQVESKEFISYQDEADITRRVTHWMQLPPAPAGMEI